MSRTFATTANILGTGMTAIDTGDWTLGAWIRPSSLAQGQIVVVTDNPVTNAIHSLLIQSGSGDIRCFQNYGTTVASSISATGVVTTNTWYCVFGVFTASDSKCRIYVGTQAAAVAEVSYGTGPTAGTGTRLTAGTRPIVGNNNAGNIPSTCRVFEPFISASAWSAGQMAAFRTGTKPTASYDSSLRLCWPLYGTSVATDTSASNITGTITGTSTAADPFPTNTVAPVVSGTTTVGQVLSCTTGTWTDAGSPTFTYQWKDGSGNISGATSSTYTIGAGEVGATVFCVVTDTDANGNNTATSNSVGPIAAAAASGGRAKKVNPAQFIAMMEGN